ncbi:MAG TPA: VOC family protein [Nocardioides sp.]|nr:VOC family protein [Nocardioides sp.]
MGTILLAQPVPVDLRKAYSRDMAWLHAVIDVPDDLSADAARFWEAALGWPLGQPWPGHPELRSFEPGRGVAYVHLQTVDAPPGVHVDVDVPDVRAAAAAAEGLGAAHVASHDQWTTMLSPGGLPFCLVGTDGPSTPEPVAWPGGHHSRLVQVCIDSPRPVHDDEVAFWRALLAGRFVDSPAPEFTGKWHDDPSPLQLLFQRLDEDEGPVRAHLDHGTDDRRAEVARLAALGAAPGTEGRGWQVMEDPVGLTFCVTDNSPSAEVPRDIG